MNTLDLIIIGGGPAGYVAALRASQLGKKVAVVEADKLGGVCSNWGCIPSKTLLKTAEFIERCKKADAFGLEISGLKFDYSKVIARSRQSANRMSSGVEYLFKSRGIQWIKAKGKINKDKKIRMTFPDGKTEELSAPYILLSTGCKAKTLPFIKVDGKLIFTSREALETTRLPKKILIVGGGAIGVEFAYFYKCMGSEVIIVEMASEILPGTDSEISKALQKSFSKKGITIYCSTVVEKCWNIKEKIHVRLKGAVNETIESEAMLLAIGVSAHLEDVLEPDFELQTQNGFIAVDEKYQTSVDGIFAAGDIIGPPLLAHAAFREGWEAIDCIFLGKYSTRPHFVPSCVYCQPQVATVGMTEEEVKKASIPYKVAKYPYSANGKAVASGEIEGFVKLLISDPEGEILGAHIIGEDASELIGEFSLAKTLESTAEELFLAIHPHPTLSEMVGEVALLAEGQGLHL
ncbi:dihydrolipoyl dehydrogenase [Candidatus Methylacidiphilum fumarolicum]|uniref:Dihydrolipoyl dehydrogenase n=2 Tax=Candidatus Methylacidiphilum fumarolicum TaxID=591154 RepID=I0JWM8_METFB|nr:dihydrolipoyl dehydrogenase [Candidatus Methylacidiphilum fumarolicum]MBW6414344.1 dihydrolipoyl dehydrogenase [Candidatus Methylacidiphilum fumarolicum]TFE66242.1 dihydrolipoyl dehydrogenase [Candidatus Methylacidiphilum fumarolicum]TFE73017.1 dihydrolipoyl dehydrogenase [Candidatus Methylacidiphilum fumarolicum]TFE75111.1 dihydrolipoyl dehydrogenase [Candidatus Methylacidiphilum fumarolicum]TFE76333.1 dihydrolipoyl dehydrogenase [Candidatus Methylacidiphilum fumarolicum]